MTRDRLLVPWIYLFRGFTCSVEHKKSKDTTIGVQALEDIRDVTQPASSSPLPQGSQASIPSGASLEEVWCSARSLNKYRRVRIRRRYLISVNPVSEKSMEAMDRLCTWRRQCSKAICTFLRCLSVESVVTNPNMSA